MIKDYRNIELKYRTFILNILIQLGLSPSCKGIYYLTDLILLAIKYNDFIDIDINLKELRESLSNEKHISAKSIKSNIEYSIQYRNNGITKGNFKNLFNLDYDISFITTKSIISLILNLIYTTQLATPVKDS